jgi:outer membrane protein assembly factor BamB
MRADRGTEALLWRQDLGEDASGTNPTMPRSLQANRNPLTGPSSYDSSPRLRFMTGPVTSSGVCVQRGRQIVCVDPLSGQTLWERTLPQADIPQHAEIFGDDELIFVADGRSDSKTDEALVLSATDGRLLGRRKVGSADRRWATHGRRVLAVDVENSVASLRLFDAWEGPKALWSKRVSNGSRGFLIDAEELAVLESSGQFTVVSLASGKTRFAVPLESEPSMTWIQVVRSDEQYLLLASQENPTSPGGGVSALQTAQSIPQRGMHGRVYASDRATGKLQWQSPAFVSHHCLPAEQPAESPLLMFVANRTANNKVTTNLLVLDRRTGRNVAEKGWDGQSTTCDIVVDAAKQTATISVMGSTSRSFTFQMTDRPMAPQPPAQTGEMASAAADRKPGVVDVGLGEAIELLRNSPRIVFPPAPGNPGPAQPAEKAK